MFWLVSCFSVVRTRGGHTPTLNSMVPQRTSIVELPSPCWILSIVVYLIIEQNVVKRPSVKRPIRPSFLLSLTSSLMRTGIGSKATTMSEIIVMTAYPVNDGPEGKQEPSIKGFHDF